MADLARIAETVACYRALDEGAPLRHHFRHADEDDDLWHFEAVHDRNELIIIKQAELTPVSQLHQYSWQHLDGKISPTPGVMSTLDGASHPLLWL
ncbi:hypothetical protein [Streptomyces sp. NPDC093707]|uniref:hypothetical protein n=1 Tax=Streptomyces sp. NPDC093707 TaxID=3154984 RepID=UPI0034506E81